VTRDLDGLWLVALEGVVGLAAHEVKDALNGVHLNLEALKSRSAREGAKAEDLRAFSAAAADQMESLSARAESLLFLGRAHRTGAGPVDVALTLRHLATLLVPAAKADGRTLTVEGYQRAALTPVPAHAARLALASGLLALIQQGGSSRCQIASLEESRGNALVRFSHESAGAFNLEPTVATALAAHQIRTMEVGAELHIVFPGS
jgi:hypothetical protein